MDARPGATRPGRPQLARPALERVAYLAVLRRGTDQLLTIGYESPVLPCTQVGPSAAYEAAAHRLAARVLLEPTIVWGDVTGHLAAPPVPRPGSPRREARLFFLRGIPAAQLPWRWIGPDEITRLETQAAIPDLATVIEGYIQGWIPAGPFTLE